MTFNPDAHHRRSIRLREYDYSSVGAYFVTICTHGRECLFGDCVDGDMRVNDAGRMVVEWWLKLPERFPQVLLDECVIMPNHFHGIICIVGATPCGRPPLVLTPPPTCPVAVQSRHKTTSKAGDHMGIAPTHPNHDSFADVAPTVGNVIGWFKTMTTNAYIHGVNEMGWLPFPGRLWQRNYYERIIRDDRELSATREYIHFNPMKWADDDENKP